MYKIIGADGAQYGPIAMDQLRRWIAEGRANGETLVQPEGSTEWKPLSSWPELAGLAAPVVPPYSPAIPAPLPPSPPAYFPDAAREVQGPAIGLIITAVLGAMGVLSTLALNVFGIAVGHGGPFRGSEFEHILSWQAGAFGILQSILQLAIGAVIIVGAIKMMKLQHYQLAMISSILALVPCVSPCCLIGLPIGIWALVVLNKPEVKAQFH